MEYGMAGVDNAVLHIWCMYEAHNWAYKLTVAVYVSFPARLSGGGDDQAMTNRPAAQMTASTNSQTSTPSRVRDLSSSSSASPARPPATAPHDAGGRSGSQANGYQSLVSTSTASSSTATSDWASSRNKDTWNNSRVR